MNLGLSHRKYSILVRHGYSYDSGLFPFLIDTGFKDGIKALQNGIPDNVLKKK
jgi:hypothetical protein